MDTTACWSLLLDLMRLFNSMHTAMNRRARENADLRIEQAIILCTIDLAGREITVSELAEALGRANHTVSVVLARLERRGLVERRRKPEQDRRQVWLRLTEQGAGALAAFRAVRPDILARFLDMDEQQAQQITGAIALLQSLLEDKEGR